MLKFQCQLNTNDASPQPLCTGWPQPPPPPGRCSVMDLIGGVGVPPSPPPVL